MKTGYYDDSGSCKKCHDKCLECEKISECTVCKDPASCTLLICTET